MASDSDGARLLAEASHVLDHFSRDLATVCSLSGVEAMCRQILSLIHALGAKRAELTTALRELEQLQHEIQQSLPEGSDIIDVLSSDRDELTKQEVNMGHLQNNLENLLDAMNEKGVQLRSRMTSSPSEMQPREGASEGSPQQSNDPTCDQTKTTSRQEASSSYAQDVKVLTNVFGHPRVDELSVDQFAVAMAPVRDEAIRTAVARNVERLKQSVSKVLDSQKESLAKLRESELQEKSAVVMSTFMQAAHVRQRAIAAAERAMQKVVDFEDILCGTDKRQAATCEESVDAEPSNTPNNDMMANAMRLEAQKNKEKEEKGRLTVGEGKKRAEVRRKGTKAEKSNVTEAAAGCVGLTDQLPGGLTRDDIYPLKTEAVAEIMDVEREKVQMVGELAASAAFAEKREASQMDLEKTAGLVAEAVREMSRQRGVMPFPQRISKQFCFVGQQKWLQEIRAYMKACNVIAPRVQIIRGAGGMGKTQIAFEYARQYHQDYPDGIFFFNMECIVTVHQSIRDVLVSVYMEPSGQPSEDFERFQAYTRTHSKCLLIYDNADKLQLALDHIPSALIPVHVLITTRSGVVDSIQLQDYNSISILPMDVATSVELLLAHCKAKMLLGREATLSYEMFKHERQCQFAEMIVGSMHSGLGGLPLALVHAASYMQKSESEDCFEEYWQLLKQNRDILQVKVETMEDWLKLYHLTHLLSSLTDLGVHDLNDAKELQPRDIEHIGLGSINTKKLLDAVEDLKSPPAFMTWRLNIKDVFSHSELAKCMLLCAALLPSREIAKQILVAVAKKIGKSKVEFEEALALCMSHSLLTIEMDADDEVVIHCMHPLVQDSVKEAAGKEEMRMVVPILCAAICSLLPCIDHVRQKMGLNDDNTAMFSSHLYHVAEHTLQDEVCARDEACVKAIDLACSLSLHLGHQEIGQSLCELRLDNVRQWNRQRPHKEMLCQALADLSLVYALRCRKADAILLANEVMELTERFDVWQHDVEQWAQVLVEVARSYETADKEFDSLGVCEKVTSRLRECGLDDGKCYADVLMVMESCFDSCSKFVEAEEVVREAYEIYSRVLPAGHASMGEVVRDLGAQCGNQDRYDEAHKWLRESVCLAKATLPPCHPSIGWALCYLGNCCIKSGNPVNGRVALSEALEIARVSCDDRLCVEVLGELGYSYCHEGNWVEGEKVCRAALTATQTVHGMENKQTAAVLELLGRCVRAQGRLPEAEKILHQSLDVMKKCQHEHEEPDWRVGNALYNLSECLLRQGKSIDATEAAVACLEVENKIFPGDQEKKAHSLIRLGRCHLSQGNVSGAEEAFQMSIGMASRLPEFNEGDLSNAWHCMGQCLYRREHYQEAQDAFGRTLAFARNVSDDHEVGINLCCLGDCHMRQGDFQKARSRYQEAAEVLGRKYGDDHEHTLGAWNKLDCLFMEQSRYEEAAGVFTKTLALARNARPPDGKTAGICLIYLGDCYKARNELQKAECHYQEAVEVLWSYGEDHELTRDARTRLGLLLMKKGRYEEAAGLFTKLLALARNSRPPDGKTTGSCLINLGDCYKARNELQKAECHYQEAVEVLWSYGEDHKLTRAAMERLQTLPSF